MTIAKRLALLRKEKGLSVQKLAESAGISRQAVELIEKGKRIPRIDTAQALCKALGITLNDLTSPD